ncbi:tRNA methyltransferase 10 A [Amphibalanus amphitrite]|uniref:tRNA (guanine(9)-N(1))-methyltransferase n=1 Tax=Amphibalanus amphitrite TaxID=1232801 RepID=A0A6A4V8R1_AMPAM|nr:tRNA methyltransferase 10 A [Amphibalanus amphitrite]
MTERDLGKCLKQVQRCYAANRRAARPVQFLLTSMEGESRRLMDANDGWQNWDVRIERDHLLDVLPHEKVTYLTSDSEHQLDKLEPGRAYVIGGLVDHNHHKGECLRRAREAGIAHARLPIDDFVEMKTRKVLTIDHVFSILLLVAGGSGWRQALQQVLPARKGAIIKGETSDGDCSTETTESVGDGGPAHASTAMFKFMHKKHPVPAERLRHQKELFRYAKTAQHGFPSKPSALAYDPTLSLMAIGTKSGAINVYPFLT